MTELCSRKECTGCGACANICIHSCISMETDSEGFIYPVVDERKCVDCNLCRSTCPVLNKPSVRDRIFPEAYAALYRNKTVLKNSASGGMFRAFAEHWTGSIYGAFMNKDFTVCIKKADCKEDLKAMQGSKYVWSAMNDIYKQIKEELENGQQVLFFGLPCQAAAVRKYIKKDYTNLICIDIVCHGAPSPELFKDYALGIETRYGRIKSISFTDKTYKWVPIIEKYTKIITNRTEMLRDYTEDPYMSMFIHGWSYRNSCYRCKFADAYRVGDITLGDFFGLGIRDKYTGNTDDGISQVIVNTQKGKDFFESLTNITAERRELKECLRGNRNLWKSSEEPSVRSQLYKDYAKYGFQYIESKYYARLKKGLGTRIKYILRKRFPKLVAYLMLKKYEMDGSNERIEEIIKNMEQSLKKNY